MTPEKLVVDVSQDATGKTTLSSAAGTVEIVTDADASELSQTADFAVWFMLPIAMRSGSTLVINGRGSATTLSNARRISMIWSSWLPSYFRPVHVEFSQEHATAPDPRGGDKSLMFFSGGTDSTAALLREVAQGNRPDLLTIQGKDYGLKDTEKFESFIDKTDILSKKYGLRRIVLQTDINKLYRKVKVNNKPHNVAHIFSLNGSAFLFDRYSKYLIAADQRIDHQYMRGPYGSNSSTNPYFSDGQRHLVTLDDDITRSEKLLCISRDREVLDGLSLCKNPEFRPENCGVCTKCVMAKVLFLAQSGAYPDIFRTNDLEDDWFTLFDFSSLQHRVHLSDAIYSAFENGYTDRIPSYEKVDQLFRINSPHFRRFEKLARLKKNMKRVFKRS